MEIYVLTRLNRIYLAYLEHRIVSLALIVLLMMTSCGRAPLQHEYIGGTPTIPPTLPGLIDALRSREPQAIINAAIRLGMVGSEAVPAVPALACILYDGELPYRAREEAAIALGQIGPEAGEAVPALMHVLTSDFVHVRRAAATALGSIGDPAAAPALANELYYQDLSMSGANIEAAVSLGRLAGRDFSDLSLVNGIPRGVKGARVWWEEQGQYMDWPEAPSFEPSNC